MKYISSATQDCSRGINRPYGRGEQQETQTYGAASLLKTKKSVNKKLVA
jgi:hypothetical protein